MPRWIGPVSAAPWQSLSLIQQRLTPGYWSRTMNGVDLFWRPLCSLVEAASWAWRSLDFYSLVKNACLIICSRPPSSSRSAALTFSPCSFFQSSLVRSVPDLVTIASNPWWIKTAPHMVRYCAIFTIKLIWCPWFLLRCFIKISVVQRRTWSVLPYSLIIALFIIGLLWIRRLICHKESLVLLTFMVWLVSSVLVFFRS